MKMKDNQMKKQIEEKMVSLDEPNDENDAATAYQRAYEARAKKFQDKKKKEKSDIRRQRS